MVSVLKDYESEFQAAKARLKTSVAEYLPAASLLKKEAALMRLCLRCPNRKACPGRAACSDAQRLGLSVVEGLSQHTHDEEPSASISNVRFIQFLVFSIWDGLRCLSWDDTVETPDWSSGSSALRKGSPHKYA